MIMPGTVAVITGGGKGVGAGIARVLCAAGARACIGYHSSEDLAQKTLAGILDKGGEAFLFKADVSDRAQVRAMIEAAAGQYGRVDALINNAAMQPNKFIREYDAASFKWLWNINIGGYWLAAQAALPYLKRSECPRIVNISSIHGKRPARFDAGYAMTKAAISMFTREAAIEFAAYGITVNCIDLGGCKIEGKTGKFPFRVRWPKETREHGAGWLRFCMPEDVGGLVAYLISPEARMMIGSGIRLDGGAMLV